MEVNHEKIILQPQGFSLLGALDSFAPLAAGFNSIHPQMQKALEGIGIKSSQVTQGWGNAKASAGYHASVGWVNGHRYSTCVDLSTSIGCTPAMKSRLVAAGFAPFFRLAGWEGNQHVHCVYVGNLPLLPGPLQQVEDYTKGLNGLVGHAPMVGPLAPTDEEKRIIAYRLKTRVPHIAVEVKPPPCYAKPVINCYAYLEKTHWKGEIKTRCEVRPLLEFFGYKIIDQNHCLSPGKDKIIDFSKAQCRLSGQFLRGNIAQLIEAIGLKVGEFKFADNKNYAILQIS